jgi:8-oxo-dGTP pyrophosphatase MutT (NUDIX family)
MLRQDHKPQGNTWGVPAGKLEKDESPAEAIIRELEEEIGYKGRVKDLVPSKSLFVRYPEYDFIYHIFALPLSERFDVQLDLSAHKEFVWITPEDALTKELIRDEDACIKLHYEI